VTVWEIRSGRELLTLRGHARAVKSLTFSPNGRFLASGGDDALVKVWDIATGRPMIDFRGHQGSREGRTVTGLAFSPDGRMMASCTRSFCDRRFEWGEVILWDAATGRQWTRIEGAADQVVFDRQSKRVASYDFNGVKVWDAKSGKRLLDVAMPVNVVAVAFTDDGRCIAVACDFEAITLWEVAGGSILAALREPEEKLERAIISPDGHLVTATSDHQNVRTWKVAIPPR
jgi:WD40 repeat protein